MLIKNNKDHTVAVPDPDPTARIPALPRVVRYSLGPPGCGPASDPNTAIWRGVARGKVPFLFFSKTVEAVSTALTIFL